MPAYEKLSRKFRARPVRDSVDYRPYQYFDKYVSAKLWAEWFFENNPMTPDTVHIDISATGRRLGGGRVIRLWGLSVVVYEQDWKGGGIRVSDKAYYDYGAKVVTP